MISDVLGQKGDLSLCVAKAFNKLLTLLLKELVPQFQGTLVQVVLSVHGCKLYFQPFELDADPLPNFILRLFLEFGRWGLGFAGGCFNRIN